MPTIHSHYDTHSIILQEWSKILDITEFYGSSKVLLQLYHTFGVRQISEAVMQDYFRFINFSNGVKEQINTEREKKNWTCSINSLTSLPSLLLRAAPNSTPETLSANFKVLKDSENEFASGLSCTNIRVFAWPPVIHKPEEIFKRKLIENHKISS